MTENDSWNDAQGSPSGKPNVIDISLPMKSSIQIFLVMLLKLDDQDRKKLSGTPAICKNFKKGVQCIQLKHLVMSIRIHSLRHLLT